MEFVGWGELFSAQWVAAWGSIVGAMLGAGLAVIGAVWFDRRKERVDQRAYSQIVLAAVKHVANAAHQISATLNSENKDALEEEVRFLVHNGETLNAFSPFTETGNYLKVSVILGLVSDIGLVSTRLHALDDLRRRPKRHPSEWEQKYPMLALKGVPSLDEDDLRSAVKAIIESCECVVDALLER
jgi:hypothetical protein